MSESSEPISFKYYCQDGRTQSLYECKGLSDMLTYNFNKKLYVEISTKSPIKIAVKISVTNYSNCDITKLASDIQQKVQRCFFYTDTFKQNILDCTFNISKDTDPARFYIGLTKNSIKMDKIEVSPIIKISINGQDFKEFKLHCVNHKWVSSTGKKKTKNRAINPYLKNEETKDGPVKAVKSCFFSFNFNKPLLELITEEKSQTAVKCTDTNLSSQSVNQEACTTSSPSSVSSERSDLFVLSTAELKNRSTS